MPCCFPKKLTNGPFRDEALFYNVRFHDVSDDESPFREENPIHNEIWFEGLERPFEIPEFHRDEPPILLPCAVCGRTFSPDSLERHTEICAKNHSKKRKPFDSAKQRVQGTELAEFQPKQETRRHQDEKNLDRTSWKKKHDDLLRTIREARGEIMDSHKQNDSLILSGAPTRANEKGTCPTCNRHFGIKAYDRHVAWCKDRITRISVSPATNLAKERLEARIRYRAPALKNRRAITREKYSPGSTANQSTKTSLSAPTLVKPKENTSMINSNRESPIKQKPAVVRRSGQHKESPTSPGLMKSRLIDRTNGPTEDHDSPPLSTSCRPSNLASHRSLHFPVIPIRLKNNDLVSSNEITPITSSRKQFNRNETISHCVQNDEMKKETCFVKTQKNIVSARSQGHPKLNNVSVNDETLGVTVQPCIIYKDIQKDNQLITWKQISHKNDSFQGDSFQSQIVSHNPSQEFHQFDQIEDINIIENVSKTEEDDLSMMKNNFTRSKTEKNSLMTKNNSIQFNDNVNKIDDDNVTWLDGKNLNQTYLIKDSEDIEQPEIFYSKWKPIKHSPRVEFYFKDVRENEICESNEKKLEEKTIINNEGIEIAGCKIKELKINNKNKENDETKVSVMEELMIDKKIRDGNNKQTSDKEIGMAEYKAEKLNTKSEKKEDRKTNNENVKTAKDEVEINTENEKNSQIADGKNTAKLDGTKVNKQDKKDQLITTDKEIINEVVDYIEVKQNLSDSDRYIEISISNVLSTPDKSKKFEESHLKELKTNFTADNDTTDHLMLNKNCKMFASQNSAVIADNYLNESMNNIVLVEVNKEYQDNYIDNFNKFKEIGDNTKVEKTERTNFNEDSDSCPNNKTRFFDRSIANAEVITDKDLLTNFDSDYGNNDIMCVEEYNTNITQQDAKDLQSLITLKNGSRHYCEEVSPNTNINLPKYVHDLTKKVVKEQYQVNPEMKYKIRKNMNLLRGSTDSLISSVEFVELASIKRPETNSTYKTETIEIIRPNKNRMFRHFPNIKSDLTETRENERSYWEKATKISRDRMIDSSCHEGYKPTKRNPKICILPPVTNPSLINHRKIELMTRPAWCSYVRRRPDFNLILKARTSTFENYDPFLLAEQQLKDLLSDASDQCITRSSTKLQQNIFYPLSHSSAFVKYPSSDKRASLIAPPSEFDDLTSDFSSDSTETNSITREVFLKSNILANDDKNVIDSASPKPVKELGRRVIIDKSKALGVDERRDMNSSDRVGKIHDNTSKISKSSIEQINSNRASSAPRTISSSNRKTLGDVKKVHGSRIIEGQKSSDQRLNQRNNSSLSGSNLSLSSIVSSSEPDIKRSNSMFDELMASFEEDVFPDLRSFRNNESFDLSSAGGDRQRNGNLISDEELSSPDSYKPQDHSKLSNDSAYSSLNRKYSHHGRSTNDMVGRFDEDVIKNRTSPIQTKCKMSKFCHECGQRFPETAKFCCECGVRRLAL